MIKLTYFKKALCLLIIAISLFYPASIILADTSSTNISPTDVIIPIITTAVPPIGLGLSEIKIISDSGLAPVSDYLVKQVATGILSFAMQFLGSLAIILLHLGQSTLSFVLDPGFIKSGATDITLGSPTYNAVVAIGWGIVRNLANAALIIGLVIIAISIILGVQESQARKLLINFILIALLINFTPVICGFFIDASNIIMNSFLTGGINGGYVTALETAKNTLISTGTNTNWDSELVGTISLLAFSLVGFVIYMLYALLFAARYVILWILVIASPIAFATKVFPQSKYIRKVFPSILYWDDWWESFIQWCVIGIPAGLFIYLSNMTMVGLIKQIPPNTGPLDSLFYFIIPLIFLVVGFFITISAGGQVAGLLGLGAIAGGIWSATGGRIIGGAKAGGEWVAGGATRAAAGTIVGAGSGLAEGNIPGIVGGMATGAVTPAGREAGVKWFTRAGEKLRVLPQGTYEAQLGGEVSKEEGRMKDVSMNALHEAANMTALTKAQANQKAAATNLLNNKKELSRPELEAIANNAEQYRTIGVKMKDIAQGNPDYAPQLIKKNADEVVSEMSDKTAGTTIYSSALSRPGTLGAIARNREAVIKGKMQKGTNKDKDNVREGFANMINDLPSFQNMPPAHKDNVVNIVTAHRADIQNEVTRLEGTGKEEDKRTAKALGVLTNLVQKRIIK